MSAIVELTSRQKRFLRAAFAAAQEPDQRFFIEKIGAGLKYAPQESLDIAAILARDFRYLDYRRDYRQNGSGGSVVVPNADGVGAILTDAGREAARQLRTDEKAARRKRIWTILGRVWALALTIAVPTCVAWLNGRIQRLEMQRGVVKPPTPPTSQP